MFVLKEKKLIRGSQAHIRAGLGAGVDYQANYTELYAPFDCKVDKEYFGNEGGNWLWITDQNDVSLQFAHLSKYVAKQGESVREGQIMAITGNTGSITTGAHLHIQGIKNGKRIELDNYNWGEGEYMTEEEIYNLLVYLARGVKDTNFSNWKGKLGDYAKAARLNNVLNSVYKAGNGNDSPDNLTPWLEIETEEFAKAVYKNNVENELQNEKTNCEQRLEDTAKKAVDEANQTNTELVKELNEKITTLQAERDTLEATKQGLQDELAKKPKETQVIVEKPVEKTHTALEYLALAIRAIKKRGDKK